MTIYHVFANRSNAGDWLSAMGIQRLLGQPVVELLCDVPFIDATLARLARATPDDTVIVGGGGLLMDYFDPFWRGLAELRPRAPLYLWGIGVVDLKAQPSLPRREPVLEVARRARLCVVRDEVTRRFIDLPDIATAPCPSLAAVDRAPIIDKGLLHVANLTTVGEPAYRRMRRAGKRWARATGRPFREVNNRIEKDNARALEGLLETYRRSDRVLTSRLHGCLIAKAMGRPVLAVSGDGKIDAAMDEAGLGDWLVQADARMRLGPRLTDLDRQPRVTEWVERAVAANARIAASVLTERRVA